MAQKWAESRPFSVGGCKNCRDGVRSDPWVCYSRPMAFARGVALLLAFAVVGAARLDAQPNALARARQLYNARQYDAAIAAAGEAQKVPALAEAASVVFARAHLEQFRQTSMPSHLGAARAALLGVDASRLNARDTAELLIGLGELAYFDEQLSAAAELFELALGRAGLLDAVQRDRLVDWWAGALDLEAQRGPDAERRPIYARMLKRVEDELRRDDTSAAAAYWLVAAARGTDDLDRAWGASIAGWIRAPYLGARGEALRADLDRFVTQVLIPERARQSSATDRKAAAAVLQSEWDALKERWKK